MNCAECEILLHALLDGELDAGHARDVEAHVAQCSACAEKLKAFRAMRGAMAAANLKEAAPASLRSRIEATLPSPSPRATAPLRVRSAIAPHVLRWICRRRGAVCSRCRELVPDCRPQRSGTDHRRRSGLSAYPFAAGRTFDGRGNQRPTHGQAVVRRQARCCAASHRPDRRGLYAARRPTRLHRAEGRSPPSCIAAASTSLICSSPGD